jgi:hypothetical protein
MEPISAILTAAGPIIALIGRAIAEGDYAKARELRQQALDEYGEDMLPVIDTVVAQEVGPSAFEGIKEDPAMRGAQADTVAELRNVYDSEGNTPADVAAMRLAQNEVSGRAASDYANNAQRLARQGQQGNAALSSALAANSGQQAVGATANMAMQNQVAARQRALQALLQSGQMAGDVRQQDAQAAQAKAGAQDRITMFNSDKREGATNQNNQNAFSQFGARMGLKNARNQARGVLASDFGASGQRTSETAAGLGNAVTSAGSGMNFGSTETPPDGAGRTKKGR